MVSMVYEEMNIRLTIERFGELEALCSSASAESVPEVTQFKTITKEKGLEVALAWRVARFAEEDAWWKEQRA